MIEFLGASLVVEAGPQRPGSERITVLEPTNLTLHESRIGVIGPNGSGKSTLVRLINGLAEASSGRVLVNGLDVATSGAAVRREVGFMFTQPDAQLVMPTPAEDLVLSLRRTVRSKAERRARALQILESIGLADKADISAHALSGGQKQLLALAGVLASEPNIVIADEPTTLLDLGNTMAIADRLFSLRQQLILVTHDLDLLDRCNRVLVVDAGRVSFDGSAADATAFYRELVGQ